MAMLINQDFNRRNLQHLRILLYFSFSTLSLGIGLGSWWAYRELGWGGYWFWDPVENISLMPWLALVMLLHCLILAQKNYHFKVWLIFLTITNVILCLLGIFLTRSGVLTSVHSFAVDLKRGFAMVAIVFAVGVFGFALFASKIATINKTINTQPHQQQHLLIWQNYLLLISLLVVFIGTIYPILAQGLWHELVSIGPEYYQQIFAVLILPFLLLIAIAHKINFSKLFQYVVVFIVAITSFFVAYFSQSSKISTWLIFFLVQFAFVNNLFSQQKIATKIAHCGFLLIIAGVATNGYFAKTKELNMQLNQSTEIAGFNIKFEQVKYISGSNFISQQGMFSISKNNNLLATTSPELRYYPVSQQTTNETSIYHNWLANIAIVLGSKDEQQNYAVRIYYKPLIYLIWCGAFLLAVSFPINFFSQNINKILTNSKQQKS
jgi:c-type cytochrome biogenesis protein CcmF